jgi:hypothetical protein
MNYSDQLKKKQRRFRRDCRLTTGDTARRVKAYRVPGTAEAGDDAMWRYLIDQAIFRESGKSYLKKI